MKLALHTETYGGNLHAAARAINASGKAEYLIHLDYCHSCTAAVFRAQPELVMLWREQSPSFAGNHDDILGGRK